MEIQPFTVQIPQADLDDLRDRLARTRWPDEVSGAAWDYGTNLAYLRTLVDPDYPCHHRIGYAEVSSPRGKRGLCRPHGTAGITAARSPTCRCT